MHDWGAFIWSLCLLIIAVCIGWGGAFDIICPKKTYHKINHLF